MVDGKKRKGSLIASTVITMIIVTMLIFSGPIAQALLVTLNADKTSVQIGEAAENKITFTTWVNLSRPDNTVPIQRVFLNLSGNSPRSFSFDLNGNDIRGTAFPSEITIASPGGDPWGGGNFGTGYGYDFNTGVGYNFGYGYGYGDGTNPLNRSFIITLNTSMMFDGSYTSKTNVYAAGSSLAQGFTSTPFSFTLTPRMINTTVGSFPANTTQDSGIIPSPIGNIQYIVTSNSTTIPVMINVTVSVQAPSGSTDITSFTSGAIPNIYFNISVSNPAWFANISNIQFRGYYNASNIPSTVAESTLRPYRFATNWQRLDCGAGEICAPTIGLTDGAILYAAGVNTTGDYVWANLSRLSTFGIAGTVSVSAPSGGSSGGTGGGGGVVSGEPFANIVKSETHDMDLVSNAPVKYTFTTPEIGIYQVVVTNKESENGISLRAEILKGTSKLVAANPPGTVYKNVNLWIGTQRVNSVLIRFKVDNTWLTNNNVAAGDVKLLKWDGSQWTQLDTAQTTADSASTSYEAKSSTLSIFAISSTKGVAVPGGTAAGATPTAATPGATTPAASPTATATKAPGFEMVTSLAALTVLITVFLRDRKRR
ncbi:MAG: PGF-pre-PGF domain-containing protein [Candidatus Methanoperedens sp.]|nr:PGF-pre-PGF domain-containing protein [Candidatus Methanoperedens sp.]MCZ7370654.1 PGF-pre-PGF domain-containing protein [Candidatus Methanoperedens sp.]